MIEKFFNNQAIVKNRNADRFTKGEVVTKLLVALLFLPLVAFGDDKSSPQMPATSQSVTSDMQSNKHCTNSDGQVVHSPTKTNGGKASEGATAKCKDGSYSFSQHHSSTFSHHGGVVTWL